MWAFDAKLGSAGKGAGAFGTQGRVEVEGRGSSSGCLVPYRSDGRDPHGRHESGRLGRDKGIGRS
jgi:hypothetical protein